MDDQQAIERYRYMLRTAPPDDIERAHAEAFARLTPEHRRVVLNELSTQVPASEIPRSDDPQSLARLATRAEMRQPGTMEQTFSRVPAGPGLGGIFLSTLAGAVVGTAIAAAFLGNDASGTETAATDEAGAGDGQESDTQGDHGDAGDFGDGGDFGGGDLGGGDFGGFGDF
jgi:hypothetical protein